MHPASSISHWLRSSLFSKILEIALAALIFSTAAYFIFVSHGNNILAIFIEAVLVISSGGLGVRHRLLSLENELKLKDEPSVRNLKLCIKKRKFLYEVAGYISVGIAATALLLIALSIDNGQNFSKEQGARNLLKALDRNRLTDRGICGKSDRLNFVCSGILQNLRSLFEALKKDNANISRDVSAIAGYVDLLKHEPAIYTEDELVSIRAALSDLRYPDPIWGQLMVFGTGSIAFLLSYILTSGKIANALMEWHLEKKDYLTVPLPSELAAAFFIKTWRFLIRTLLLWFVAALGIGTLLVYWIRD